jgi:hypothetical protein
MNRPVLPTTDHSVVWLADLIKVIEVVAASSQPCDPITMKAFSDRLAKRRTTDLVARYEDDGIKPPTPLTPNDLEFASRGTGPER